MRELETGHTVAGSGGEEREDNSEETESSSQETLGSLEQLDLLFEKEQGVVRRAGWLSFKPLLTLHKDRKLELVARRKWKQYWVTLKGKSKKKQHMCRTAALSIKIINKFFLLIFHVYYHNKQLSFFIFKYPIVVGKSILIFLF